MESVIEIKEAVKTFGKTRALDELSMEVARGSIHGFLGPNGAGKTTTLRALLGLLKLDSGSMRILGKTPRTDNAVNTDIAYIPGDVNLWGQLRGGEVLQLLASLRGSRNEAKEQELIERFELDPTKKVRAYSKGNRQKVALIAALSAPVQLLLLDEPTAGLDPLMEEVFTQALSEVAEDGVTVLLSSHILSEVERTCSDVTIIRNGKTVLSGPLSEVQAQGSLQDMFLKQYGDRKGQ